MGQLWSNESGSINVSVRPTSLRGSPITIKEAVSQAAILAVAKGARTPMDIATDTANALGVTLVGSLVVGVLVLVIYYLVNRPNHPFVFTKKKESFVPMEEADESWVPV